MGDFRVRKIRNIDERQRMYKHAINDIKAFEIMLKENMFVQGNIHIGAEQELCIVDEKYSPSSTALEILEDVNDDHFTNELALFNLEINLDPLRLGGNCFSSMEHELKALIRKGQISAEKFGAKILQAGILPTLKYHNLDFKYMTPEPRYETISKVLAELRGTDFEIHMQGVDEFIMSLGSVLFEACNTSFQLHLQIDADDFVNKHNWSQMITGPVLSSATNSPTLFGKELWAETRIGLFKQSLDTRTSRKYLRSKVPRVYYGKDWLRDSAAELWKGDLMRFPLLFTSDWLNDSIQDLNNGKIPELRAIRLHSGTTYTWNRLCYGPSQSHPHLRIECRYLPSGPSIIDEIANFAFWIGLMVQGADQGPEFWKDINFVEAKDNFLKASRNGMDSVFNWFGKKVPAQKLILEVLLPMAHAGLEKCHVMQQDISRYLGVIQTRAESHITGSSWIVHNYRTLRESLGESIALKAIVKQSLINQNENIPVHNWKDVSAEIINPQKSGPSINHVMTRDIVCVNEDVSLELAKSIFDWNEIHHLPVENSDGDLVGLITDGMIHRLKSNGAKDNYLAKDIMIKDVRSVDPQDKIIDVLEFMDKNEISGLPVTHDQKLIGIFTKNDLRKLGNKYPEISVLAK